MPKERISKFFAPGTPVQKMEDTMYRMRMSRRSHDHEGMNDKKTGTGLLQTCSCSLVWLIMIFGAWHPGEAFL